MPRLKVATDTPRFEELRGAVDELRALTAAAEVDLVSLGRAYQRLATALHLAATERGPSSMRYAAAAKALDLTTPKSAITAFLEPR